MPSSETWRLIARVFVPFVAGYYLSYLFRAMNALIAGRLLLDTGLGTADIGLLTSVYFFVFAAVQIPIGILLDRLGPRRVQSLLLLIAAVGAGLFSASTGFLSLLVARAMIGIGVAASLTAGLKSIILWFPRERVGLLSGYMVMLGSLGAVTATAPAEYLLAWIGWRQLFVFLATASAATAVLIYFVVPEQDAVSATTGIALSSVFGDRRFWRIAPLSATCAGSSWSLQGLWATLWLADVEGIDRIGLVKQLMIMSIVSSGGAWLFGMTVHCLKRRGRRTEAILGASAMLFIAAELLLILRAPLPSILPWSIIAGFGTAPVVSFATMADYFPRELAGRANSALNVLHFGWAFLTQYLTGVIIEQWTVIDGHRPVQAYQVAFGVSVALQIAALVWFSLPSGRYLAPWIRPSLPLGPANVFEVVESVSSYENSVILIPVDGDAEW